MSKVTAFEAKTRFGELLERVSRGEEVVITRHNRPVAKLVPIAPSAPDAAARRAAVNALLRGARGRLLDGAKPLLGVAQCIACPSGLFDHDARLRQARLPFEGNSPGERQPALRAGDMLRIRHAKG